MQSLSAYGQAFGSSLDWSFKTTTQASTGTTKTIHAGKTLGGSTAINGGSWGRPDRSQIDGIGSLGNEGWSWDDLETFMKHSENSHSPNSAQSSAGAQWDSDAHGTNGPLDISFPPSMYSGPQQPAFVQGLSQALNVTQVADLTSGDITGVVAYSQDSILPDGDRVRVSSATAYLSPVESSRKNLVVLLNYRGISINWASGSGARATGVVAKSSATGPSTTFGASKEVIVAAGALRSPVFLESSGIGDSSILSKIGVSTKVNLPGVGRNLQEQTMNSIGTPSGNYDFGGDGPSNVIAFPNIYQLMSNASDVRSWIEANMDDWAQAQANGGFVISKESLLKQWNNTLTLLFDKKVGAVEFFGDSGYPAGGFGIDTWQMLPFSRGSIHATSASGFSRSTINPNYFSVPADMQITVAGLRGARKVLKSNAVSQALGQSESVPGFQLIPDGSNSGRYDRWASWVLDPSAGFSSVAHPIATCSMLPEADGGVVGSDFLVYHTQNVRVVDASVLPTQISAHLSATLYGIAEKAASVIAAAA